jgi:spore germination cell wall hydrolase CwlJ-like protein
MPYRILVRRALLQSCIRILALLALLIPLSTTNASISDWTDSQCLASAIYYEARGEPLAGKRAVLDTIANRMLAKGKSACAIIFERRQFSWAKKKPLLEYTESQRVMLGEVVRHRIVLANENHLWFYSGEQPVWARGMTCRRVGNHNFCKGK